MEFARHNKKLVSTVSIATIILVLVFNVLYYIFAPIQSQGNPKNFVATPILEQANQATQSGTLTPTPQQSTLSIISLSILLIIVLLLIVIIFALLKYKHSQRVTRDKKRKDDLRRLAQAFEAYREEHGQYPLSSTYQPQYYTGINLSNDWNYYGLPNKEHMVRYLPDWPISDPSIDYHAKHQVNQYIYYPKENGQKFFLYAHLEAPGKEEQIDYNHQDNLLRSWGAYNYRVSSGNEQPSQINPIPHPQHTKVAPQPAATQPTPAPAPQSEPQAEVQTLSSAVQPIAQSNQFQPAPIQPQQAAPPPTVIQPTSPIPTQSQAAINQPASASIQTNQTPPIADTNLPISPNNVISTDNAAQSQIQPINSPLSAPASSPTSTPTDQAGNSVITSMPAIDNQTSPNNAIPNEAAVGEANS